MVTETKLYDISELEQEIVSNNNKNAHFKGVEDFINDIGVTKLDKIRLVMLFTLRYENDEKTYRLKDQLKE